MDKEIAAKFIASLAHSDNLLITGHLDPDGDCVGTMLAFYHAFDGGQKGWQMILEDDIPAHAAFMAGAELIGKPADIREAKAILLLDCAEVARAGEWLSPYWQKLPAYILDHHPGPADEAQIIICDTTAAATGELAADMLFCTGIEISRKAAGCLYAALVADTACFRYMNTTPHTLEVGARLLAYGLDAEEIRINLFENLSRANIAMLACALSSVEYHFEGRLCLMSLSLAEKTKNGALKGDCSNIINYTIATKGVKVGILLDENEDDIKVSIRCRRGYEANKMATRFGGGGHLLAAGCRIAGDIDSARRLMIEAAGELAFATRRV